MDTRRLITSYLEAFNAGDTAGMEALVSVDLEHHVNQGQVRHGLDAFKAFNIHMSRCYEERLENIVLMFDEEGTRAAAEFTVLGRYLATDEGLPEATGQYYELPAGIFFSVRAGCICRIATSYNLNEWLAQIGAEQGL